MITQTIKSLCAIGILLSLFHIHTLGQSDLHNVDLDIKIISQYNHELDCMSKTIYYEASLEPYAGKTAVAQTVLNRLQSKHYPKSICGVVTQSAVINKVKVYQFSFWSAPLHKIEKNSDNWKDSVKIARKCMNQKIVNLDIKKKKVLYFHAVDVNPAWNLKYVKQIGNHIFYAENDIKY